MFFTWDVLQFSFLGLMTLIIISQLIIPPFIDMPYFWLFRKSEKKLLKTKDKLSTKKIDQETIDMEKQIDKLNKKILF